MTADDVVRLMADHGIELVSAVPDSLLAPLCRRLSGSTVIRYVQTCDEATAVGLAAGATLGGARALAVMENSGLRRACETLSRFTLSHRLHCVMLLSHRGAFGEANWWGVAHSPTMRTHLEMLRMAACEVNTVDELSDRLDDAYAMLATGQQSVALVVSPSFCEHMADS
ncbi:thiamine pyrophosphate-binding protein [Streptomyces sp. NPDC006875]|uniref:thiamine pyrophosphate-binding protein n=1 Tax=Streptomyces sp. NPDC006875 TaxID=3154781 RepID=UPI003406E6F2